MTRLRGILALALGLLLVGVLQAAPPVEIGAPIGLWDPPFVEATCSLCTDCQAGGHATIEGSEVEGLHEKPLECKSGTCNANHGPCLAMAAPPMDGTRYGPGYYAAVVGSLREAVTKDSSARIARLLSTYAALVRYVPERAAIQVLGCDGQVVVHLPLDEELRAAPFFMAMQ